MGKRKKPSITLVFPSERAKRWVLGQLSDGFGENHLTLSHRGDFDKATTITVKPMGDVWEHHERMRREHPEWFGGRR